MGTNYYFMTRNKDLVHKHFAAEHNWGVSDEEYKIVDDPYLGYEIHLNKLSFGWRPLFQKHKEFDSWDKLEAFYMDHKDDLEIYNEYGDKYEWIDYKKRIFDHAAREPEPMKWYYGIDPIDSKFTKSTRKRLYHDRCKPEEADFWIPIDHVKYFETEKAAKEKYKVWDHPIFDDFKHWNDENPEYLIDWTEGDFS